MSLPSSFLENTMAYGIEWSKQFLVNVYPWWSRGEGKPEDKYDIEPPNAAHQRRVNIDGIRTSATHLEKGWSDGTKIASILGFINSYTPSLAGVPNSSSAGSGRCVGQPPHVSHNPLTPTTTFNTHTSLNSLAMSQAHDPVLSPSAGPASQLGYAPPSRRRKAVTSHSPLIEPFTKTRGFPPASGEPVQLKSHLPTNCTRSKASKNSKSAVSEHATINIESMASSCPVQKHDAMSRSDLYERMWERTYERMFGPSQNMSKPTDCGRSEPPTIPWHRAITGSNQLLAVGEDVFVSQTNLGSTSKRRGRPDSNLPRPSSIASYQSANSWMTGESELSSPSDETVNDRRTAEQLQALEDNLLFGHEIHAMDDVTMQNATASSSPQTRTPPIRDYRAHPDDIRRLLNNTSKKNNNDRNRHVIDLTMETHSSAYPAATETSHKCLRKPRGSPLPGYANTRYGSSKPTGLAKRASSYFKTLPLFTSTIGRLKGRGTRDDPIEFPDLDDQDQDMDMFNAYDRIPAMQERPDPVRDCAVCGDSNRIADMPSLVSCTHRDETCAVCFASWIKSELSSKGWKGITCPTADCSVTLTHQEIQRYAHPDVFARYDLFAMREALSQVSNFRWCRNPTCKSGQEHDEGSYIFTCIACGHKVCVMHNVDWHEGETCDEYTYRASGAKEREQRAQEEASIAAIKECSKKCPGPKCIFNIQKNEGCDHMTCKYHFVLFYRNDINLGLLGSRCHFEFCWECLADYNTIRRNGNGAHAKNCRYHSSRIR